VNTNAYVTSPNGAWLANDTASGWIGPVSSGGVNVNAGGYNYQTTFPLAGFLPGAVQINMSVAADDSVTNIYLNGISTESAYTGFTLLSGPFTVNSGFVNGTNTLEFRTLNGGTAANPHGFRAVLSGTGLMANTN